MKHDVLKDSFWRILLCIGVPIYGASIVTMFTTVTVNDIYSNYAGQTAFSVMGVLNMALSIGNSVIGSMALAAWIKGEHAHRGEAQNDLDGHCLNVVTVLAFLALAIILIMLLGEKVIFRILNVPLDIWQETHEYYVVYVWVYLFYGISMFFGYVNTARGSSKAVLISNLLTPCGLVVTAFLFCKIFHMGVRGVALSVVIQYLLLAVVNYILLRKQGIIGNLFRKLQRMTVRPMIPVIRYGLLLAAQIVLCSISEIVLSIQTNRYLSVEYLAVIALIIPLGNFVSVATGMGNAFIPQNYGAGQMGRLKDFMRKLTFLGVGYAIFNFVLYASIGKWYFSRLFLDADIVGMGAEYWFWYGASVLPVTLIAIFRTFFETVGKGKIAMLSGIGELAGRCLCAFWLIPCFGNIGRSLGPLMGYGTGATLMLIAYGVCRKRIYKK